MSRLSTAQGAIAAALASLQYYGTADNVFRDVQIAGGQFSEKDLARVCTNAPAAVLSMQRMGVEREGGFPIANVEFALVVSSKGEAGNHRYSQIVDIVSESLVDIGSGADWGLDFLQTAEKIQAENLYTPKLDAKGVTMWAIGFTQKIDMVHPVDRALEDFDTFHASYPDYEDAEDLLTDLAT